MKFMFDLFFSIFGLLVLLPLFVVVAIWIKLDSDGPVFFRQVRVGKNGRLFHIHKFRSMRVDSELGGKLTVGNSDSRVTRAGHFIRKYKIDELPQLIDVFYGDMSLVGPRPEVPEYVAAYSENARRAILSVKPGITDNASVLLIDENEVLRKYENPQDGYLKEILPLKQKLYLDYVENRSLIGDILIIIKTIRAIFRNRDI